MIDPAATYASIGAALACGFLIGLEREQAEAAEQAAASADPQGPDEPGSFGGVRTFTLLSLVGGLAVVAGLGRRGPAKTDDGTGNEESGAHG